MRKLPIPRDLEDFWHAQSEWSQATFGTDQERGPLGPLKHLKKEVEEAISEVVSLWDGGARGAAPDLRPLREEITDCLFLVFDAARRAGMTHQDLVESAFRKLEINKGRKWGEAKEGEAVEHLREGEER